jgi:hypothetical protein
MISALGVSNQQQAARFAVLEASRTNWPTVPCLQSFTVTEKTSKSTVSEACSLTSSAR